jgi:hypothetical protein
VNLTTRTAITRPTVTLHYDARGAPCADVQLAPGTYVDTRDPLEAAAMAAVFTRAARLLRDAEPHQPQAGPSGVITPETGGTS